MSQLGFDFDGPANRSHLEGLLEAGEQPGVVNRTEYLTAWATVNGSFDSLRRSVSDSPWLPWRLTFTGPGALLKADELHALQADGCRPTILSVDTRPDRDEQGPGDLLYRGACLGCDWEGPPTRDENEAVEDAHDHVFPAWWRSLPTITRPGQDLNAARQAKYRQKIIDLYETHAPGSTTHPAGCPVWTARQRTIRIQPDGNRSISGSGGPHHDGGPLGGYDLGRHVPDRIIQAQPIAPAITPPEPKPHPALSR